jgi:hypothetical protein
MNKKIFSLIIALSFMFPVILFATEPDPVHTSTKFLNGNRQMYKHEITWEADDGTANITDITIPASTLKLYKGCYIYRVITDPGTTKPTDDYSITIKDEYGYDLLEGQLASRDQDNTEAVEVTIPIYSQLTIGISGNSQTSAQGKIILLIVW